MSPRRVRAHTHRPSPTSPEIAIIPQQQEPDRVIYTARAQTKGSVRAVPLGNGSYELKNGNSRFGICIFTDKKWKASFAAGGRKWRAKFDDLQECVNCICDFLFLPKTIRERQDRLDQLVDRGSFPPLSIERMHMQLGKLDRDIAFDAYVSQERRRIEKLEQQYRSAVEKIEPTGQSQGTGNS